MDEDGGSGWMVVVWWRIIIDDMFVFGWRV